MHLSQDAKKFGQVVHSRLECLADGVDGVGGVLPLGGEDVAEVKRDVQEELVQQVAGRLSQQILKGKEIQ